MSNLRSLADGFANKFGAGLTLNFWIFIQIDLRNWCDLAAIAWFEVDNTTTRLC